MDNQIIARINWVPTERGGKKRLPLSEYSTAAHFLADDDGQHWSVVLKIVSNHNSYETICNFNFLFPERAPENLLYVGSKFELYETKKVADGEIIEC